MSLFKSSFFQLACFQVFFFFFMLYHVPVPHFLLSPAVSHGLDLPHFICSFIQKLMQIGCFYIWNMNSGPVNIYTELCGCMLGLNVPGSRISGTLY